tara:strand:- start:277 stop:492 length:216 start_codon:yes stop_codon:yes gene_type:complete
MEKKTQQEILDSHYVGKGFGDDYQCPQCKSLTWPGPLIENEDEPEELPQVYCNYGCGYIFLTYKEPQKLWR